MVGPVVIDQNGTKQTVSLATAVKLVLRPPRHLREIKPRPRPVPGISFDPHRNIDREGIVEAYRNGDLVADISERFGVHVTTVLRYARQAGLPTRHNGSIPKIAARQPSDWICDHDPRQRPTGAALTGEYV